MSGLGSRFVRAGYKTLKPLIEIDGMPMVEHVVRMFPGETDFVFICARNHLEETPLRSVLQRLVPGAAIVPIDPHRRGPVHAVQLADAYVKNDEPVIVTYCDITVGWDYENFKRVMQETKCDGCLTGYRGFHPYSLGTTLYAYMRESDHRLLEIQEKHHFTKNRMDEYASSGTYYFRSGALMKKYFQAAVDKNLQTNGEYYASMPYNLLVADSLNVQIYPLQRFLHWGIPEDLQEYVSWSRYFAQCSNWKPALSPRSGTNLIPMAGAGSRFSREGYVQPKPLVPVKGVPLVQRALDSLPPSSNWITACYADHLGHPQLQAALNVNGRKTNVIRVEQVTEGQACTCLLARDQVDPAQPLLIAPCDASLVYDEKRYAELTADSAVDCLVWTFRNHPHANRHPRQYGWVKTGSHGEVQGISCKHPLGEKVNGDPGIIGAFWFRKAQFFFEAADALIAQNRRINNEFYVDSTIDVLIEQGRQARIFDVEHYIGLGTPDDVRTFEYWESYFRTAPHHPYGK